MGKKGINKNIRKLTKTGGHSIGVTVPIDMIRELKWQERQKVVVEKKGKTITIRDWPVKDKKK